MDPANLSPAREQVYCHECQEEWYRDEHGLVCPNETCRSDFVEIIENANDPRGIPELLDLSGDDSEDDNDNHHHHHHDLYPHLHLYHTFPPLGTRSRSPGGSAVIRTDVPGIAYVTRATFGPQGGSNGSPGDMAAAEEEIIADLFSTMLRNIVGDQFAARNRPLGNHVPQVSPGGGETRQEGQPSEGGEDHRTHFQFGPAFGGRARLNPRNADASQAGEVQVPDINAFLASLFGPQAGDETFPPVLARLLGVPSGAGGDYVYSQAELDRIVSQLMEQHQGNAPPPAAKEDIEALPKVTVTEQMVNEGLDCAVCKEDLVLDEQVTTLPCHHSYHLECVSKWLEAHDTCPICRHPITPEDRRRQNPSQPASPTTSIGIPNFPFLGGLFSPASPNRWAPMSTRAPGTGSVGEQNQSGTGGNGGSNTSNDSNQSNSGSGTGGRSAFANIFRRRGS